MQRAQFFISRNFRALFAELCAEIYQSIATERIQGAVPAVRDKRLQLINDDSASLALNFFEQGLQRWQFTYLSGREVNVPLRDPDDPLAVKERSWLKAWAESGTRHLTYYPYTDWSHPDAAIHWYFNVSDLVRTLKRDYQVVGMMGETHTTIQAHPMWWAIYARTLWDVDTDYQQVIAELCQVFYGPAGKLMTAFYLEMDQAVLHREGPRAASYHPNRRLEFSLDELQRGRQLLQQAARKVDGDAQLLRRVDHARFAHAVLTLTRTEQETTSSSERTVALRRQAFDDANRLRKQHTLMVRQPTSKRLATPISP